MFRILHVLRAQLLQHLRLRKLKMDSFSFVASPGAFPKDPPARAISSNLKSPPVGDDLVGPVIRLMGVSLPTSRHLARFLKTGRGSKTAPRTYAWDLREVTEVGASEGSNEGQRDSVEAVELLDSSRVSDNGGGFVYSNNSYGRRSRFSSRPRGPNDSGETNNRRRGQDDIVE